MAESDRLPLINNELNIDNYIKERKTCPVSCRNDGEVETEDEDLSTIIVDAKPKFASASVLDVIVAVFVVAFDARAGLIYTTTLTHCFYYCFMILCCIVLCLLVIK